MRIVVSARHPPLPPTLTPSSPPACPPLPGCRRLARPPRGHRLPRSRPRRLPPQPAYGPRARRGPLRRLLLRLPLGLCAHGSLRCRNPGGERQRPGWLRGGLLRRRLPPPRCRGACAALACRTATHPNSASRLCTPLMLPSARPRLTLHRTHLRAPPPAGPRRGCRGALRYGKARLPRRAHAGRIPPALRGGGAQPLPSSTAHCGATGPPLALGATHSMRCQHPAPQKLLRIAFPRRSCAVENVAFAPLGERRLVLDLPLAAARRGSLALARAPSLSLPRRTGSPGGGRGARSGRPRMRRRTRHGAQPLSSPAGDSISLQDDPGTACVVHGGGRTLSWRCAEP